MLFYYLFFIQVAAFILFAADKYKARHKKRRIAESTLLLSAVAGGSLGALLAMYGLRHKTRHKKFTWGIPLILLLQIALFYACGFKMVL